MLSAGLVGNTESGRVSPQKVKAARAGSTVISKKSVLMDQEAEEARRGSVVEGDALTRI